MDDFGRDITLPARTRVGLVLLPVAFLLFVDLAAPHSFGPPPPTWLGIRLIDFLVAGAVGWGLLGGILVARNSKPWALAVGFLVFTFPALFAVILGPALILILQNLV